MSKNQVRIIGGRWKGQKLRLRGNASLRPTLGRVRETLFNWLAAEVADSHCLDLFAGSGALGFEALSRGARSAVLVDNSREAVVALRRNAERLGTENCVIRRQSALGFLHGATAQSAAKMPTPSPKRAINPCDLVFLDPPFASNLLTASLEALRGSGLLREDTLVYYELERGGAIDFKGWTVLKQAVAGDAQFGLLTARSLHDLTNLRPRTPMD